MTDKYAPQDIRGKSIVVTGGSTGIGRAAVLRLAAAGANVFTCGRHQPEIDDMLATVPPETPGKVFGVTADMASLDDVMRFFAEAETQLGSVEILVNNAALAAKGVLDMETQEWKNVIDTNLTGYIACCQEALTRMTPRGVGHIVNVGSMSAKVREKGSSIYVATKAGIEGFSEALRKEVNELGIKVTLIEPGLVGTDMTVDQVPKEEQEAKEAEGTMLTAEDLAECIYYTLTQPQRCDVVLVQIRPHKQAI